LEDLLNSIQFYIITIKILEHTTLEYHWILMNFFDDFVIFVSAIFHRSLVNHESDTYPSNEVLTPIVTVYVKLIYAYEWL
jgi:hypothetical protein